MSTYNPADASPLAHLSRQPAELRDDDEMTSAQLQDRLAMLKQAVTNGKALAEWNLRLYLADLVQNHCVSGELGDEILNTIRDWRVYLPSMKASAEEIESATSVANKLRRS